jgi:hypothetical protein
MVDEWRSAATPIMVPPVKVRQRTKFDFESA